MKLFFSKSIILAWWYRNKKIRLLHITSCSSSTDHRTFQFVIINMYCKQYCGIWKALMICQAFIYHLFALMAVYVYSIFSLTDRVAFIPSRITNSYLAIYFNAVKYRPSIDISHHYHLEKTRSYLFCLSKMYISNWLFI